MLRRIYLFLFAYLFISVVICITNFCTVHIISFFFLHFFFISYHDCFLNIYINAFFSLLDSQICASVTPLHPVMPQLIDVYVNSIILPASKGGLSDTFNEPISEEEIMSVFSQSIFTEKASSVVNVCIDGFICWLDK